MINDEPLSKRLSDGVITAGDDVSGGSPSESPSSDPSSDPSASPDAPADPDAAAAREQAGLGA